jgi:RNA polymerase sigma-70 factor (ECF subfamily)
VDDETIYRKNRDDLIRYTTVLVGPAEAEDVVSVVVLRVLAKRRLQDLEEPRAYLFRAVLNECKTRLSRRRAHLSITEVGGFPADNPQPHVIQAVLDLPPQQRAATYLVYWAGMTVAETADLMAIRPGTVKRYLHLARRNLKGVLDEH